MVKLKLEYILDDIFVVHDFQDINIRDVKLSIITLIGVVITY